MIEGTPWLGPPVGLVTCETLHWGQTGSFRGCSPASGPWGHTHTPLLYGLTEEMQAAG